MLKTVFSFFGGKKEDVRILPIYNQIVAQARQPAFYRDHGVPDSLDGRFDLIMLHAILVIRKLNQIGPEGEQMAQDLFDLIFADMDNNLREIGVGDLSVGKRVKAMAKAFYGRAEAYEKGLAAADGGAELKAALTRNLYGTCKEKPAESDLMYWIGYINEAIVLIENKSIDLLQGKVAYPSP